MNYKLLTALIENILEGFKCPNCGAKTNDENIEIIGVAGRNINLSIKCSTCDKNTIIKAEANELKLGNLDKNKLDFIKKELQKRLGDKVNVNILNKTTNIASIEEAQIIELDEKLQKDDTSIEDLLK